MPSPLPQAPVVRSLPRPGHLLVLLQAAAMVAVPHGGQRAARRNAWAGMSADSARGRARREADTAMQHAELLTELRAGRSALGR